MEKCEIENSVITLEKLYTDVLNKTFSIFINIPPLISELIPCLRGNSSVLNQLKVIRICILFKTLIYGRIYNFFIDPCFSYPYFPA